MMNISSIHQKIEQLSPQLLTEVEDYVDFLLQKYQMIPSQRSSEVESSPAIDFFATHIPLKSFLTVEPTEYVNQLRQNSRIKTKYKK